MGSGTMRFLVESSYVANLLSIYAAFHEGASGAALNMLGCFCQNQQELLQNNPELTFFHQNPHLHSPIPQEALLDKDHALHAWQLYLRIYQIQRGLQPYSARCLADLLLRRQVRLDSSGEALTGSGQDPSFNQAELDFLWEATNRSCSRESKGNQLCRIRFLNELLERHEPELYIQGTVRDRVSLEQGAGAPLPPGVGGLPVRRPSAEGGGVPSRPVHHHAVGGVRAFAACPHGGGGLEVGHPYLLPGADPHPCKAGKEAVRGSAGPPKPGH